MGPQLCQWLLLGIFTVLFMDQGIRFCNKCDFFNGSHCTNGMKHCWKFNAMLSNRSCRTDHFYFSHRLSGTYLYRYSQLSCDACEEGMFQVFHDVLRETYCCTDNDRCNNPDDTMYIVKKYTPPDGNRETNQ